MNWETAAQSFAAMGSDARLQVLRALVRAGTEGLTVGHIQTRTGIPASTLAHHLKFLTSAGVVEQTRIGRSTVNTAKFEHLEHLAHFILCECFADAEETGHDHG